MSVPVSDRERARAFYTELLGFAVRADNAFGPGRRWIEVVPPGGGPSLSLTTWFGAMPPGGLQGLVVATGDIAAAYAERTARGCRLRRAADAAVRGILAVFRDPDGNGPILAQP